jgi:DNA invertase Pin-like site-specific DNA recombinase
LGSIAEFERDLIRERILAGMARARAEGRQIGRARISAKIEARIRRELQKGHGMLRVARMLKVGTGTVQRIAKSR